MLNLTSVTSTTKPDSKSISAHSPVCENIVRCASPPGRKEYRR